MLLFCDPDMTSLRIKDTSVGWIRWKGRNILMWLDHWVTVTILCQVPLDFLWKSFSDGYSIKIQSLLIKYIQWKGGLMFQKSTEPWKKKMWSVASGHLECVVFIDVVWQIPPGKSRRPELAWLWSENSLANLAEPKAMNTLIITEETRITDVTIQWERKGGFTPHFTQCFFISLLIFLNLTFPLFFTLTSENFYIFILSNLKLLTSSIW